MKKLVALSLFLLSVGSVLCGQDLLFFDNFKTSSEGSPINTLWKTPQNWAGATPGAVEVTTDNSRFYFGQSDNGYLHLWREDIGVGGAVFVESRPLDESIAPSVVSLAFDFYRPEITSWGTLNNKNPFPTIVIGRENAFGGGAGNRVPYRIEFAGQNGGISGASGLFQGDTVHSLVFVYNNSSETITYSDGSGLTLGPSRYDLWMDGERVRTGIGGTPHSDPNSIQEGDPLTTIGFGSFSREGEILIDNIALYSGAVGPRFIEGSVSEGYTSWAEAHFLETNDPAVTGPEADPDGDGVSNLLEYALGTDPLEASRDGFPVLGMETFTVEGLESEYLTLEFSLVDGLSDLDFAVEVASVMGDWTEEGAIPVSAVSNGDGTTLHKFRDSEPVDSNARRFMRLQVSIPEDTAQATLEIGLSIKNIPPDGLVFQEIPIGNIEGAIGEEIVRYRAEFVSGDRSYEVQVVPGPYFGERNSKAMLLLRVPGEEALTGTLRLEREFAEDSGDPFTVNTGNMMWMFDPQGNGIFPVEATFGGSGRKLSAFSWNDRLHERQLGSFFLRSDSAARSSVISEGTVATVVRGRARYWRGASGPAPGDPSAIYDWYFFKDSPQVFIDVRQSGEEAYRWSESWFSQWIFQEAYFSDRLDSERPEPVSLTGEQTYATGQSWAALSSDAEAVAIFGGPATVYDAGNAYIRAARPSPGSGWDGRDRRLTAWLWASAVDDLPGLPWQLDEAAELAVSRFADTRIHTVHESVETEVPSSDPPALQQWKEALLQREFLLGRLSPDGSGVLRLPDSWRFSHAGELGLAFALRSDGVELISLYDLGEQRELAADEMPPLFALDFYDPAEDVYDSMDAGEGWESVSFQDVGERLDFHFWRGGSEPVSVTVSASAMEADSAWEWEIRVGNSGSAWSVTEVAFPQVALRRGGEETRAFVPQQAGIVIDEPFRENFRYDRTYPTGSANMQFMAIYPGDGSGAGLYVARHDPVAARKQLVLTADNVASSSTLSFSQTAENPEIPGNGFEITGSGVWKLLRGDWYDAAQYYGEWVRKEAVWWPEVTDEGRADTPLWYRELNVWSTRGGSAESVEAAVGRLRDFLEMPLANHWYYWHEIPFDNDYPHYFPAVPGFEDAVAALRQDGVHSMPYINGRLWDTRDRGTEDHQFSDLALPWATKVRSGGELVPFTSTFNSTESDGSAVVLAVMCPYTEFWQDKISEIVGRLAHESGVSGVYLDQVGTSTPVLCLDPEHGHPLGGGSWWVEGYAAMLSRLQSEIPNDVILTTEDNAEPYMKNFDGVLTWQWLHNGQVPAFAAVYGGAIQMFGRSYTSVAGEDPNLAARMKMGQQLVFGEQIGWISPELLLNRLNEETRQYFKRVVQARAAFSDYFYAGKMLRPPEVEGANPEVTANWRSGSAVTLNSVLTAAWKKRGENRMVLIFTNVTDMTRDVAYRFDPAAYGIPATGLEGETHSFTPSGRTTGPLEFDGAIPLSLPGFSSSVWEIRW